MRLPPTHLQMMKIEMLILTRRKYLEVTPDTPTNGGNIETIYNDVGKVIRMKPRRHQTIKKINMEDNDKETEANEVNKEDEENYENYKHKNGTEPEERE